MTDEVRPIEEIAPELVYVSADDIEFSEVNANKEDTSTFDALKRSIEENGILEVPSVQRKENGKFGVISGEHRLRTLLAMYGKVPVLVSKKNYGTAEEEFSVVQNMNLIRGTVTMANMRRVIAEKKLDASKIDLHGIPKWMIGGEKVETFQKEADRKKHDMEVKALALEIARALATMILEERDEDGLLVCEAGGKAVVMAGFGVNVSWLRENRQKVRDAVFEAIREMPGFDGRNESETKAN